MASGYPRHAKLNWNQILKIFQTKALKQLVSETVESVKIVLKSKSCETDNSLQVSKKMIQVNLDSLGVIQKNASYDEMTNSDDIMKTDLKNLNKLLHLIKTKQKGVLINLKDDRILPALKDYSVKINK